MFRIDMRWWWMWGVIVGLVAGQSFQSIKLSVLSVYDSIYPVTEMNGNLVHRDGDSAWIRIAGTKTGRDCVFLSIQAYGTDDIGVRRDAMLERIDGVVDGHSKPPGEYDLGIWRIWTLGLSTGAEVWVSHDCDGRRVVTQIAKVQLQ